MRIVLDTNVVVSAFLSPSGFPARLLAQFREEAFDLLVSDPILQEYRVALAYPKVQRHHGMANDEIAAVVAELRRAAILVTPVEKLVVVPDDPDDDKLFECAVTGGAHYIV